MCLRWLGFSLLRCSLFRLSSSGPHLATLARADQRHGLRRKFDCRCHVLGCNETQCFEPNCECGYVTSGNECVDDWCKIGTRARLVRLRFLLAPFCIVERASKFSSVMSLTTTTTTILLQLAAKQNGAMLTFCWPSQRKSTRATYRAERCKFLALVRWSWLAIRQISFF